MLNCWRHSKSYVTLWCH